jgi:hypothetical protein
MTTGMRITPLGKVVWDQVLEVANNHLGAYPLNGESGVLWGWPMDDKSLESPPKPYLFSLKKPQ